MRLKTLEISGFKSFADKTRIDFLPGMTGIVGPNGSGKSNIAEAVRWVLGEQSAKSLRGSKMPDVIFGGSTDRHALNRAAVAITLDNSDHYLKSAYTELTISRVLYRSGESEYLLNGQNCRLKDITELLMDSGMGQDSFSIISQGRVEAIFNSKPEDRRTIIEEVAGVYKYRKHKETAQHELDGTMGDLHRVEDIIAELEGRLEPLERQRSLAQDYLDQQKKFAVLDRTQLVRQLHTELKQKKTVDAQVVRKQAQVAHYQAAQKDQQRVVQQLSEQQTDLLAQKDTLQDQLVAATQRVEQCQGQVNLSAEQRRHAEDQRQRLATQLTALQQRQQDLADQLTAGEQSLKELRQQIATCRREIKELRQETADKRVADLRDQLEKLRADYFDQKQQVANWRNQRQYLQQDQDRQQKRSQRLTGQLQELKTAAATAKAKATDLAHQATVVQEQLTQAEQAYDAAAGEFQQHQATYRQSQRQWQSALGVYQQAKTRAANLQASAAEYGGFYQGVRAILRQRDRLTGLIGAVSELLKVPTQFTTAIEYALGGQLQHVVVTDEAAAKAAVAYLREQRAGRATFLPLTTVRGRQVDQTTLAQLANVPGFLGVGSAVVTIDQRAQGILTHLLGTTLLAQDLDAAVAISQRVHHRYRVVSLAGDVVSASGAITGGQNRSNRTSVLHQRQELQKLEASLATMQTQLQEQEQKVQAAQAAMQTSETQQQDLQTTINDVQPRCRQLNEALATAETAAKQADRQLRAAQMEIQQATDADQATQAATLGTQIKQGQARIAEQEAQQQKLQAKIKMVTTQQSSQREVLTSKQTWLAGAQERLQQQEQNQKDRQTTQQATQQELAQVQAQQRDLVAAKSLTPEAAQQRLEQAQRQRNDVEQRLQTISDQLTTVNDQVTQATADNDRTTGLLQVANDDLQEAQVKQTQLSSLIDQQQNQLSEKYQMSLAAAEADVSDLPADDLAVQLKLLKRGLDEIGPVNLNAIEEYQTVHDRYTFLTQQRDDLLTAKEQLTTTMAELDGQVKTRFQKTFTQIATKFSETFQQMFGGGKAQLVLTDPRDLLTTGIDIMAQPPGKKFQNMGLLSGGERALTAITLLFAILQVQPVPFCILDEVEAALDPANVTRFARYMHQFQDQTQFIVITHRKETMVQADVLYGVTMQESGVSKMVTVDLDQQTTSEGKPA